jgi:hypothetical protein
MMHENDATMFDGCVRRTFQWIPSMIRGPLFFYLQFCYNTSECNAVSGDSLTETKLRGRRVAP